ncbi:MAG: HWE histidine kinase domain-containing protein [Hyphomonas sp.]
MTPLQPLPKGADILASVGTPIIMFDRELRIAFANPAYLETFKKRLEDIAGRYVFDVYPESEEVVSEVRGRYLRVLEGEAMRPEVQPYRVAIEDGKMEERFWRAFESPLFGPDGTVTHVVLSLDDVTSEVRARRQKDIIARELEHRLRNTLTMVGSLAIITSHNATSISAYVEDFLERLHSISRTLMTISDNHWQGLSLRRIIEMELSQVISPDDQRVRLEGPDITLSVRSSKWTALMVHEMITNAVRYGCFSVPDGTLTVVWKIEDGNLISDWTETGRGENFDPDRKGFGSRMLELMPNMTNRRTFTENGMHLWSSSQATYITNLEELSDLHLLA